MLGGENIGTAYVRIVASGSGLNQSIRDSFDDSDEVFDQAGNRHSKRYKDAFADEMGKTTGKNSLDKSFSDMMARNDALDKFLKDNKWVNFRKRLKTQFGDAGALAGKELEQELIEGMDFSQFEHKINNLTRVVSRSVHKIQAEEARQHADALSMNKRFDAERLRDQLNMLGEAHRMNVTFDRQRLTEERNMLGEAHRMNAKFDRERLAAKRKALRAMLDLERAYAMNHAFDRRKEEKDERDAITDTKQRYKDLIFQIDRMKQGLKLDKGVDRGSLRRSLRDVSNEMGRLGLITKETHYALRDHERDLALMHPTLNKVDRAIDDVGDSFGKSFGKGSRNDFLNFVGSVAGGIPRLTKAFTGLYRGGSDFFGRAALAGRRGGPLASLGSMLGDISKLAAKVGGAFAGAYVFVGPLIAAVSQLSGLIVALAGNLAFALVGAAGAAGGALVVLGIGVAAAISGFKNLSGEAKKAAGGVKDAFMGLGKSAAEGLMFDRKGIEDDHDHVVLSFTEMMHRVEGIVHSFEPLMVKAGRGIADAINIGLTGIDGKALGVGEKGGAIDKFVTALTGADDQVGWITVNVRTLGRTLIETFGGVLGLFRGLMPITSDFIGWMRDLSVSFNNWANGAKGQNQIKAFMDEAKESAIDFGSFLAGVRDIFNELIDSGRDTGDSLFASMGKQLSKWADTLKDNPDILKKWFDDAEHFGHVLGNLIKSLGNLFDALDNEFSRALSSGAINLLADAIRTIADTLHGLADMFGISENKMGSFAGQAAAAAIILPRLSNAVGGTALKFGGEGGLIAGMRNSETRMNAMKTAARGLAGPAGIGLLIAGSQRGGDAVGGLENILGGAAIGFSVGGPIGAAVGGLGGAFITMAQHAAHAGDSAREAYLKIRRVDAVKVAKASLASLKDTLDQVTGAYTGATRAAALQKLQEADLISVGRDFGVSARQMVNAALGQKGAMNDLYPVVGKVEQKIRDLTARQKELADERNHYEQALKNDSTGQMSDQLGAHIRKIDEETLALEKNKKELQTNLEVLRQMPGQLRKQGREVQNAAMATADYSGYLHGIPKDIRSEIQMDGIRPSVAGIAKVAEKYDLVDRKHIKTLIEATGTDFTVKQILDVIKHADDLDKKRPRPKVDIDKGAFDRGITAAHGALTNVGQRVVSPKIQVESNVSEIVGNVNYALDHIADEVVNIVTHHGKGTATGGLFNSTSYRMIGEAGPEAVVPLNRPLGEVDPSVRWLSAIAQGKGMASGGVVGSSKTVDVGGITVISNSDDPHAVAVATLNQLVASTY